MGREQLQALAKVIEAQLALDGEGYVIGGTWEVRYDKERNAFEFDKCEFGGYCEERPSVVALDGRVIDAGGPIIDPGSSLDG